MRRLCLSLAGMAAVMALVVTGCSKENETNLQGGSGGNNCDTVNMKYSADVLPIIRANCYSCHGNGAAMGGISLDGYANLKVQADNGNLVGVITHANGYPPMPMGAAQLSECDINKIKDWIANGKQNN